jgi:acetyl-CoA C-acetyltransferase
VTVRNVGIIGFGQTRHVSRREEVTFPELVKEGTDLTLEDAGIDHDAVEAVVFPLAPDALTGVSSGERWCVDAVGAVGKPFMRVNNGGATGMSAVLTAWTHIASGMFDVVLVSGADRVSESGSAQSVLNKMWDVGYERPLPLNTITMLALSACRYMHKYGSTELDMARVSEKNRYHASLNPYAHLQTPVTVEEVLESRLLAWPIKLGDACPASTGAAGVVLASEDWIKRNGRTAAWIRGIGQNTETFWMGDRVGPHAVGDHADAPALATAFRRAYDMAGLTDPRTQVHAAEIYAPFSSVELHVIEAAGLAALGEAPARIADGEFRLGAPGAVVNPSGGTQCTNPITVTGAIRVGEAALQVLGRAEKRQVADARVAIASAIGGDHQYYSTMVLADSLEAIS